MQLPVILIFQQVSLRNFNLKYFTQVKEASSSLRFSINISTLYHHYAITCNLHYITYALYFGLQLPVIPGNIPSGKYRFTCNMNLPGISIRFVPPRIVYLGLFSSPCSCEQYKKVKVFQTMHSVLSLPVGLNPLEQTQQACLSKLESYFDSSVNIYLSADV